MKLPAPRHLLISAALAASTLVALPASGARAEVRIHGIVIGHNGSPEGRPELSPLRYADDDAMRFAGLLQLTGAEPHMLLSADADTRRRHPGLGGRVSIPSPAALDAAIERVARAAREDIARGDRPVVFFTYSGHGVRTPEGRVELTLAGGRLGEADLRERILPALAHAHVHLFVDACHAGGLVGERGAFDREIDATTVEVPAERARRLFDAEPLDDFPTVGAFLAAAEGSEAHEWSRVESGLFTHEAVSGLLGAADVNGDLRVEYGELQAFISAANSAIRDPRARTRLVVRPPGDDANQVLLDLRSFSPRARWLVGDAGGLGRFHVELEDGTRVAEARIADGTRMVLAWPRDQVAFVVTRAGEARIRQDAPTVVALGSLSMQARRAAARGARDASYDRELFGAPYGATYYLGFMDSQGQPPTEFGSPDSLLGGAGGLGVPRAAPSDSLDSPRMDRTELGLWLGAAGAAVALPVGIALAVDAHQQISDGTTEREAYEQRQRYRRSLGMAIGGGVAAASLSVAALIRRRRVQGRPEVDVRVGQVSELRVRW